MTVSIAVAAIALTGLALAGTASGSVLCKSENFTTGGCSFQLNTDYPVGAGLDWSLETSTSTKFEDTEGKALNACTTSTWKAKMFMTGAAKEGASFGTEPTWLTFANCTRPTVTTAGDASVVARIAGTDNGKVTPEFGITITIGLVTGTCSFRTVGQIGTLTGGLPSTIDVNAVANHVAGVMCPETIRWTGSYVQTEPAKEGIWVAEW